MTSRPLNQGLIGIDHSETPGLYLLQVTEVTVGEALQVRATMDEKQLRWLISKLVDLLPKEVV